MFILSFNRTIRSCLIIYFLLMLNFVYGDDTNLYKNIVKIETSENYGFGFIVYERDDFLYIATADHVIKSRSVSQEITVKFYYRVSTKDVTIINRDSVLDLVLLKVKKPGSDYYWEYASMIKSPQIGDEFGIIGRYGRWHRMSEESMGEITYISGHRIKAKFNGAAVGSSGGPLISSGYIIGMITQDEGNVIEGISIKIIKQKIIKWLQLEFLDISDLPIVTFGLELGGSTEKIFAGKNEPFLEKSATSIILKPGIYADLIFYKYASFRLEASYRHIYQETNTKYTTRNKFRNDVFAYSALLNFYHRPLTQNFIKIEEKYPFIHFITVGFAMVSMKPEINIDHQGWTALSAANSPVNDYSKECYSYIFGVGTGFFKKSVMAQIGLTVEYFTNKHIVVNIVNPVYGNDDTDWIVTVNFKIGLYYSPPSSNIKLLR